MTTDQETGSIESIRILLIEDNEPNRRLLEDYLIYQGFEVCSLAVGTGFERALQDFNPQIVLLDLKLPDIDGYDILEQMQDSSEWREIPVVVVSARAFNADQQRALSLGARRYLVKPIRLLELLEVIRSVLRSP
ncbi:MAG: response regulator [Leptolyngbya sp. Prado105]|jgi:two-component system cell cycle response regulator DivK|nr:response regulator [Leptolyngbya sp. Prado105]